MEGPVPVAAAGEPTCGGHQRGSDSSCFPGIVPPHVRHVEAVVPQSSLVNLAERILGRDRSGPGELLLAGGSRSAASAPAAPANHCRPPSNWPHAIWDGVLPGFLLLPP